TLASLVDFPARSLLATLSLHDALPISGRTGQAPSGRHGRHLRPDPPRSPRGGQRGRRALPPRRGGLRAHRTAVAEEPPDGLRGRSEEHTSELQSRENLVCRLLLAKTKK